MSKHLEEGFPSGKKGFHLFSHKCFTNFNFYEAANRFVSDCFEAFLFSNPLQTFLGSREVREFASGALAGAMSKAVLAPLETIRYSLTLISIFILLLYSVSFIYFFIMKSGVNFTPNMLNLYTVSLVFFAF